MVLQLENIAMIGAGIGGSLEDAWALARVLADALDIQRASATFELRRLKRLVYEVYRKKTSRLIPGVY